jgi:hypothetical protein
MRIFLILILFFAVGSTFSQRVYETIDTTNIDIKERIDFIRKYYKEDGYKQYWHPKYKDIDSYQFGASIEKILQ